MHPWRGLGKGQVENQVGLVRRRFFSPRPKAKNLVELNRWLRDQCVAWAIGHKHPSIAGKTVWEVFREEKEHLIQVEWPFDGYSEENARVSSYSPVSFDRMALSAGAGEKAGRPAPRSTLYRMGSAPAPAKSEGASEKIF